MLRPHFPRPGGLPGRVRAPNRLRVVQVAPFIMVLLLNTLYVHRAGGQNSPAGRAERRQLTLPMVIQAAARAHPVVLAAEGRLRAARGNRATAGTIANPVLTYQVENAGFPGRTPPAGVEREISTYATLPLEPFWQRGSRVGRANSEVEAAEAQVILARRTIALDAARAFHRTALAQASVAASTDVVLSLDSLVRYTGTRVREGAAAAGDLLRLQVERDRVATEAALQEAELALARAALRPYLDDDSTAPDEVAVNDLRVADDVTGVTANAVLTGSAAALFGLRGRLSRDRLTSNALATRPDVLAARASARAAASDVSLQHALTVRQLGATFGSKNTGGTSSMIAGLSVPIPLFDRNRGEVQRAQGERTAVEQELRWAERRAFAEVLGAYDAAEILTTRVDALQRDFLARAEASRRVALAAYREGAVPLLQVLDATRTLADARLIYLRARYAQQDAVLALHVAAGFDPADALPTAAPTRGSAP